MKILFYAFVSFSIMVGCTENTNLEEGKINLDTSSVQKGAKKSSKFNYYTTQDTLQFITEYGDTIRYAKEKFNQIVDNFPEFYEDYTEEPKSLYGGSSFKELVDKNGNGQIISFGSEAGEDNFFVLYAYFLKMKNGDKNHSMRRKKLINLYQNINSLFAKLQYGGTYFGHQHLRILGFAEYSIYIYEEDIRSNFSKTYGISKQKKLYIQSLHQLINDENTIDFNTLGSEKTKRLKSLHSVVDDIEKDITDYFYLRRTQDFHYKNYQYY